MVLPTGSPQAPFGPSTHESKELGVVDDAVGVGVGLVQYLGDLLLGERLAQVPHHDGQLAPVDEAVAVLGDAEGDKRTGEIKRGSAKGHRVGVVSLSTAAGCRQGRVSVWLSGRFRTPYCVCGWLPKQVARLRDPAFKGSSLTLDSKPKVLNVVYKQLL